MKKSFINIDITILVSSMMLILIVSNETLRYGHLLVGEWHQHGFDDQFSSENSSFKAWSPKCEICQLINHTRYYSEPDIQIGFNDGDHKIYVFTSIENINPRIGKVDNLRGPPFI